MDRLDILVTFEDMAEMLGVHVNKLYGWRALGTFPFAKTIKLDKRYLYRRRDVELIRLVLVHHRRLKLAPDVLANIRSRFPGTPEEYEQLEQIATTVECGPFVDDVSLARVRAVVKKPRRYTSRQAMSGEPAPSPDPTARRKKLKHDGEEKWLDIFAPTPEKKPRKPYTFKDNREKKLDMHFRAIENLLQREKDRNDDGMIVRRCIDYPEFKRAVLLYEERMGVKIFGRRPVHKISPMQADKLAKKPGLKEVLEAMTPEERARFAQSHIYGPSVIAAGGAHIMAQLAIVTEEDETMRRNQQAQGNGQIYYTIEKGWQLPEARTPRGKMKNLVAWDKMQKGDSFRVSPEIKTANIRAAATQIGKSLNKTFRVRVIADDHVRVFCVD